MTARVLGRVLLHVVLVGSGAYVFIYFYRWQWNMALVAGLLFIATEMALVASVLLRRLQSLEDRLDELQRRPVPAEAPAALEAIEASAPPRKDRFAWLSGSRTSVFIPVLLGAGVLLSGVATVVERLAGATARPVLEHRLAFRLQPLALPAGGLLGAAGAGAVLPRPRRGVLLGRAFAVAVAALLLYASIDVIGDVTQTRPDPNTEGLITTLVLSVSHREAGPSAVGTTEALWAACQSTLRRQLKVDVVPLKDGRVSLALTPGLGPHVHRRVVGCLEDVTFERVQVDVVSSALATTRG
ncbi:MAG TPA: hypothetical protein VE395_07400 [Acidimicrobiales bacterium]|nr:hypothetical protein [Acidimicrobiales bacterium]